VETLAPLLESLDKLEHLRCFGLANYVGSWGELLPAIGARPFWRRLESLDLSHGQLQPADVEALARLLADAPGKLRTLRVEGTTIGGEARTAPDALGLVLEGTSVATPSGRYRYVVTME